MHFAFELTGKYENVNVMLKCTYFLVFVSLSVIYNLQKNAAYTNLNSSKIKLFLEF